MLSLQFTPKLFTTLRSYSIKQLTNDVMSGVVVGIVALPLAIAFAIASGVKPEQGLYTAIISGFIIALLGGSRVQVSGPTGAFIVIVYSIVEQFGYSGLAVATFMAGFIMVGMGFARMGLLLRYVPYPVTVGFTSGIALIIFSSQVKDFFGLSIEKVPAAFIDKWALYINEIQTINPWAAIISIIALGILILFPKMSGKVPGSIAAILLTTVVVQLLNIPVETIGSKFGSVPSSLPTPHILEINLELIRKLLPSALTIAFLGSIESLLSAVVADGMLGTRHRSNMELIAQGVGNIVSPLFMGIPATGAIARTAVNIKAGGRTPVAAIVHAVVLLIIMLGLGRWAALIPMPTLAAILMFVAYNMSEWRTFKQILRTPKGDVSVLLATFLLTVLIDLTVAIEVGVVLSAFLFMKRMENETEGRFISSNTQTDEDFNEEEALSRAIPIGIEVFELSGPLFFGAVERFKNAMRRVEDPPKILILQLKHVPAIDATGLHALDDLVMQCRTDSTTLLLSGLRRQPFHAIRESGLMEKIGLQNIFKSFDKAVEAAQTMLV